MSGPPHIAIYSPDNVATEADGRLFSPSFPHNYAPIREALGPLLAGRGGAVLEIGSGTGQHVAHLARDFPDLAWVPSDMQPRHFGTIAAWRAHLSAPNHAPAIFVDATADWARDPAVRALGPLAGVFCSNVLHIAPWSVAEGLVRGAARALAPGGPLILYGPFARGGRPLKPGNAAFDAGLRADNPAWGVRDLDAVSALATAAGLGPAQVTQMPSDNLLVAFARA